MTTNDTPLGIGIIGAGLMGTLHAACYQRAADATVAAWYNPTRAKAEAAAANYGGTVCASVAELLARDDVAAVCIASPQTHHCAQITAAAQAGKHIFCEKPVALEPAELAACEAAVATAGVTAMTGHQLRFHPVTAAVRRALPRLGAVYHVDLEWCLRIAATTGRCWESYRQGGFFMELGCHLTDLARCLGGDIRHVSGHTLRLNPARLTEDYAHCLVAFADGAVGSLLVSANHRTERQGLLRGRVLGEHGRIDFTIYPYARDYNAATLVLDHGQEIFVPDTTVEPLDFGSPPSLDTETYPGFFDVYQQEAAAFVTAVRTGAPPPCTLRDGCEAVRLVLATYDAQARATASPNYPPTAPLHLGADAHPALHREDDHA